MSSHGFLATRQELRQSKNQMRKSHAVKCGLAAKRKQTDAEKALEEVHRILSKTSGDELSVLKDFAEVFSIAVRGWELRVQELEAEAECLQKTGTVWRSGDYEAKN